MLHNGTHNETKTYQKTDRSLFHFLSCSCHLHPQLRHTCTFNVLYAIRMMNDSIRKNRMSYFIIRVYGIRSMNQSVELQLGHTTCSSMDVAFSVGINSCLRLVRTACSSFFVSCFLESDFCLRLARIARLSSGVSFFPKRDFRLRFGRTGCSSIGT